MKVPRTRWRLAGVAGNGDLDVEVIVDTTAPVVVEAIERAAAAHGIELHREPEPEHATEIRRTMFRDEQ